MEDHTEGHQYWVLKGGWALTKGAESVLGRGTVWGKAREAGPGWWFWHILRRQAREGKSGRTGAVMKVWGQSEQSGLRLQFPPADVPGVGVGEGGGWW